MTSLHQEIHFEDAICQHLAGSGWLYETQDSAAYDRARALYPSDVLAWVQESQPQAWESLVKSHGATAQNILLDRLRKQMDDQGTLSVLRHGIELVGLRSVLKLAQFKPALAMNVELQRNYAANRLRVMRQVRYSLHNENAIDLVLFLNGIPVATVELKSNFTQSVEDAVNQYRFDRQPKSGSANASEPLLTFVRGALVHFAVSQSEVRMTTRLSGPSTTFLPFNLGNRGGAGNPSNPNGFSTAYLWEHVWERESWLEIIGRYIVAKRDKKKAIEAILFPRYHQLDVTRKLVRTILDEGPGRKYLVQHSAGSGKTNSIAWTAHFLADLHDDQHRKLFDTVLVVSDRTVLDTQLQEAIFDFERTAGVVVTIKGQHQSKSGELAEALSGSKKIVVCTIQTFPRALEAVQQLAATQGKKFAVIADEAHSSQTGEAASKLKQVLSAQELSELGDGGEFGTEDILAAQMAGRAAEARITYVAFTATPKAKTLELFGRVPDPTRPSADDNRPEAFHVYSMRQAIEEGFILDVLRNYTTYSLAFKLASSDPSWEAREVDQTEAKKGLMRWVRLHPYNIAQKVQVVVEHFRENVALLLGGKAKAMVVVGSRLEAVRWKLAIEQYIHSCNYGIGTLVAFSGEVSDAESHDEPLSENSRALNPNLRSRDIREAFNTDEYAILLVANKFQTGFDQPLLCGMYVDKRLSGIQAVQTLSRLNRSHPGKDTTYILDFVNDAEEILSSFKAYHETAELDGVTDPNLVYDLRARLDAAGHYDDNEVDRVVNAELRPGASQKELCAAIEPVAERLLHRYREAQSRLRDAQNRSDTAAELEAKEEVSSLLLFKKNLSTFLKVYAFLSQIFDYGNTSIEKRSIFYKRLVVLLDFGREREGVDLSKLVLTHHRLKDGGNRSLDLTRGEATKLQPLTEAGSGLVQDKERILIAELLAKLNDLFEGDVTENDKLVYANHVKGKLLESEVLIQQACSNTKEQFSNSPDLNHELSGAVIDALTAYDTLSKQALESEKVREGLKFVLLGPGGLYEALRAVKAA